MIGYTVALVASTLVLIPVADLGWIYTVAAVVLGAGFLGGTIALADRPTPAASMRVFAYSITYVTLLFGAMTLDVLCDWREISALVRSRQVKSCPRRRTVEPHRTTDEHSRSHPRTRLSIGETTSIGRGDVGRHRRRAHDERPQGDRPAARRRARCSASLIVAALGVMLGIERIDGDGSAARADDLTPAVRRLPGRPRRGGGPPAAARRLRVRRPLATRRPIAGLPARSPPPASGRGSAGVVLLVISLVDNGGPLGGDATWSSCTSAANILVLVGLTAVAATLATSVLTTRAPGMRLNRVPLFSWAALVGSIGLVLVLPVAVGVAHLPVRRLPATAEHAFGGSSGISAWTFVPAHRARSSALLARAAVGFVAERRRRDVLASGSRMRASPSSASACRRGGLRRGRPAGCHHAAGHRRARSARAHFGHEAPASSPCGRCSRCSRCSAWSIVLGDRRARRQAGQGGGRGEPSPTSSPRSCSRFFGLGHRCVGMLGAAANGIDDLGLQGTVFEEGATVAIVYGAVLAGLGAVAYWFAEAHRSHAATKAGRSGWRRSVRLGAALASMPYLIAGFADQPATRPCYEQRRPGRAAQRARRRRPRLLFGAHRAGVRRPRSPSRGGAATDSR